MGICSPWRRGNQGFSSESLFRVWSIPLQLNIEAYFIQYRDEQDTNMDHTTSRPCICHSAHSQHVIFGPLVQPGSRISLYVHLIILVGLHNNLIDLSSQTASDI